VQAEISQGRLESLLNFQTMVCDMTGMDISNASLLDEVCGSLCLYCASGLKLLDVWYVQGTAAAEAVNLCTGQHSGKRLKFFVASDVHPQTIDVVKTRCSGFGIEVVVGDPAKADWASQAFSGVLLQVRTS
jgi:glycine dehydrogenase